MTECTVEIKASIQKYKIELHEICLWDVHPNHFSVRNHEALRMKRYKLIILPLLLTVGPFWMVSFLGGEWTFLRVFSILGALCLSLGLMRLLSKVYALQQRIEWLEGLETDEFTSSENRTDPPHSPF